MRLMCYTTAGSNPCAIVMDGVGGKVIARVEAQFPCTRLVPHAGPYVWGLYRDGAEPEKFEGGRDVAATSGVIRDLLTARGVEVNKPHWSRTS